MSTGTRPATKAAQGTPAAAGPGASATARRRYREIRWHLVALGAIVVGVGALVAYYSQRYHLRQNDEYTAVGGARFLAHNFPSGFWDTELFTRGPERLTAVLLMLVNAVVHPTASQFAVGHVVVAMAWALTAVPTYALARGVGLGKLVALAIAALAVLNPWAISGTNFLNTTLGYLTFTTLLYAMWRTTVRPTPLADMGVLFAFAFAALARVGHTPFVLALAPAILVQSWRDRPIGEPLGRWLPRMPGRVARDHRVLVVAGALGVALLALKGERGVLGNYGSEISGQHLALSDLWLKIRVVTARVSEGLAFVPVLFALPWLARELVRPRRRETGALAVLAAGSVLVFFYVFLHAGIEDRYMVVLVPPILVAFGCALVRADVPWIWVAAVGAVVARAVATVGIYPTDEPFSYFIAGASQFFKRVVLNKLAAVLPFGDAHVLTIALVLIVLTSTIIAAGVRLRGRAPGAIAAIGVGGVLLYSAVASGYVMDKFMKGAAASNLTFDQQTYVDRAAGDTPVGILGFGRLDRALVARWNDATYFNGSIAMGVSAGRTVYGVCCSRHPQPAVKFKLDKRTGIVRLREGTMPRLILVPTGWLPFSLNGQPLVTGYDLMRVERLPPRVHASFVALDGTYWDGWGKAGRVQRLRAFPSAAQGGRAACLTASVSTPAPVRFRLRTGADRVEGKAVPGQIGSVRLRLGDRPRLVRLSARGSYPLPDGRKVGVRLEGVQVAPCTS